MRREPHTRIRSTPTLENITPLILHRPRNFCLQHFRRVQRPVRVVEHGARHDDQIGLAARQNLFCEIRRINKADGAGGDARAAPDFRRKRHLISGKERNFLPRIEAAARTVDEIDLATRLQQLREPDRALEIAAAFQPVDRRQPHEQRHIIRPFRAHRVDRLEQQADAVLKTAAVAIGAAIGERRQELVDQVPVRGVQLHDIESRLARVRENPLVSLAVLSDEALGSYHILDEIRPDIIVLGFDQLALREDLERWMREHDREIPIEILDHFPKL